MSDHYFVTADHGHLRIYRVSQAPGQRAPGLEQVEAMDFPSGVKSYTDRDTAMAGRFQGSRHQAAAPGAPTAAVSRTGMSIDERLPMQREEDRRRARNVAQEIETFFAARPGATYDLAAASGLSPAITALLSSGVGTRLRRTIPKDLVNQPAEDLRAHLTASGSR